MCISTVNPDTLRPSSRYVLLKEISDDSLLFFTNYQSRKAVEIEKNPLISGVFYWPIQNRSVRFEGKVQKVSHEISDKYFDSRPLKSRLSGIVSKQSSVISAEERQKMSTDLEYLEDSYSKGNLSVVQRPEYWGGFKITPDRFEFWQGQNSRFHDRFLYTFDSQHKVWEKNYLAP